MKAREPRCTWDSAHGWLTPEHERDCDDHACRGCKPCPKTHCALKGRCESHVDVESGIFTCPRCIGRTRRDIAAVVDLYAVALPEEAEEAGDVESEALNLSTPASPYSVVGDLDDDRHPYRVLGHYDLALRETYGPPTAFRITVTGAAKYLTTLLAGPFPHGPEFEEFAKDVAACRTHLEAVIHDSRAPELGRPCPRCAEAAEAASVAEGRAHGVGRKPKPAARLRKRYAQGNDATSDDDTWHCPDEPEHWWTEHDYREKVAADYVEHAPELPARELAERIKVPLSRVRKWCAREWDADARVWIDPLLVSRKRGDDGRKLYRVEDAQRLAGIGA